MNVKPGEKIKIAEKQLFWKKVLVRALLCLHSSGGKSIFYLHIVGATVHSCANACNISVVRDAAV